MAENMQSCNQPPLFIHIVGSSMAVLTNISEVHMQITLSASVEENDTIVVGWLIISG